MLLLASLFCMALFSALSILEIFGSKNGSILLKVAWTLLLLLTFIASFFAGILPGFVILVFGNAYLLGGRKSFVYYKNNARNIEFDSI
jgi:hypothetical protein